MMTPTKLTKSAAVIFLLRVSATLIYWHSINDLSRVNVIATIVLSFVYLVFLSLTSKRPLMHTMSRTRRYLIDIVFLAGSVTVIIRLLECYSPWAATLVFLGIAEAMALSNTGIFAVNYGGLAIIALEMALYLMKNRDWGIAAVLGLCTLIQTLKHVNGWLGCKSICVFGWVMLKGLFGELKNAYDFLDNKEMKEILKPLIKTWEQDEIFREANPHHPKWQHYNDAFVRRHFPQWKWGNV